MCRYRRRENTRARSSLSNDSSCALPLSLFLDSFVRRESTDVLGCDIGDSASSLARAAEEKTSSVSSLYLFLSFSVHR